MTRCEVCGTVLQFNEGIKIGMKELCRPVGGSCQTLYERSRTWTLSVQEAQALLSELFEESA